MTRREFVQRGAIAVSAGFLGLQRWATGSSLPMPVVDRYGPLVPDLHRIVDLPAGFSYQVLSWTGDRMSDGLVVPGFPDGMGAFSAPDGNVVLIRNHELESKGRADFFRRLGPYGPTNEGFEHVDPAKLYDLGANEGYLSIGGTTSLVYDPRTREKVSEFLSLAGTERNCAGGVTPWGTWITCEESTETASNEFLCDHGYPFEVRPTVTPELQGALRAHGKVSARSGSSGSGHRYRVPDRRQGRRLVLSFRSRRSRTARKGRASASTGPRRARADGYAEQG